jgi:PAS domain S-box-containing protein
LLWDLPRAEISSFEDRVQVADAAKPTVGIKDRPVKTRSDGTPHVEDQAKADMRQRSEGVHQVALETQNEQLLQAQAALQASRDRYLGLFEQAPVGYVTTGMDGLVTEANRLAAQMLGLTVAQLLRRRLSEYFALEHRAHYQAACARLLRDGGTESLELDLAPVRGPRLSVTLRIALVADDLNSTRQLRVAMMDITDRLRLQTEHARLAAIIESSDDAIISRDGTGRIVSWNRGAERLLGFTAGQMVGQPLDTIVPPERRAEDAELLQRLRQGRKLTPFEGELRHSNGFRVPVLISLALVHDDSGRGVGSSLIARDVSERKRAERALHKRLRQLDVLSQAGQALILAQPGAPPVQHELFDRVRLVVGAEIYLAFEAAGEPNKFQLTASHGLSERARAALNVARTGGSLCGMTALRRTPLIIENLQASTLPEAATLQAEGVRSYAGFPLLVQGEVSAVAEFASLTRDQFREGDLQVMQTVCDQVAAMLERNRLLQELNEREYSLRIADRRKDDFIATLAHELRNPLAPIRNAVSILRRSTLPDPQLAWCRDVIERQVLQMTRLLEDLLDVSRVTRNKIDLRRERIEVTQIVEDAIETTRPLIDAQRHRLTITLPDEPIVLWGDLTRLTQVVANLLNNAAKYTDTGGHIDVTVERHADEVAIGVRDSGIGIDPLQVPRVFDMFAQLKPALERSRGGLGIGLSLSRALVEMHGGRIEASSAGVGEGSTFVIHLPIVHHAGDAVAPADTETAIVGGRSGRRVLVVDDNADAASTLATMLSLHGFETRLAFGGKDGLRIAEEWQPDVAVIDIGMPQLNGYELCRLIREQPWGERMLMIACTGWGQNDDRERARAAGFDVHLVKPIKPDELVHVISGVAVVSMTGAAPRG